MKETNVGVKLPLSLIFLFIICLPPADDFFHIAVEKRLPEKRRQEQKGTVALDSVFQYIQQYTRYFNDGFLFRGQLIRFHNKIRYKWFNVSAVPRVIAGKEGWLFQARKNEEPGTPGYFNSIRPFTNRQLEEWRRLVEQRRQWLAQRGIDYLLILVPDKSSVYPEYLPDSLRPLYRRSRLDQLAAYLRTNSDAAVLDVGEALRASKNESPVYYKTDSHWNEYGAWIAYREIVTTLAHRFENVSPLPRSDFRLRMRKNRPGGNLAVMLSLHKTLFREGRSKLIPRTPFRYERADLPAVRLSRSVKADAFQCDGAGFPKAVMFHDSFGRKLKSFLPEHFSRVVFIRDWGFRFHGEVIEKEKPAIVLDEIAEHFLYDAIFDNSPMDNVQHSYTPLPVVSNLKNAFTRVVTESEIE